MSKLQDSLDHLRADGVDLSNLTGGQIQKILDFLIIHALSPIIRVSDLFDAQLAYLLSATSRNKRRKLSAMDREQFMTTVCHALISFDKDSKIQLIAGAKIERHFLYNFVIKFLIELEDYPNLYHKFLTSKNEFDRTQADLKMRVLEQNFGISRDNLLSVIRQSTDYLNLAYSFRNSIVQNYIKMTHKQAISFVKTQSGTFDLEDVHQNFLTAVTKAIDKYDCSKGAITSYINWWIMNAQDSAGTGHGHEYGIAFSIPQLQRKSLATGESGDRNFSVSLDSIVSAEEEYDAHDYLIGDPGVDKALEARDDLYTIQYLAKCADYKGLARLYLDIDEVFSLRELIKMKRDMKENGFSLTEVPKLKRKAT